jgi:adhesin/invasin
VLAVTQTGTGTGVFGPVTNHNDGTYTAWFQGRTAGTTTIGALIDGQAVTTPLPSVTVAAGPASTATSVVSAATGTVSIGGTTTIDLQVFDPWGNPVTDPGLVVTLTALPTTVGTVGPVAYVTANRWSATFTAVGSGSAAITATIGGAPLTTPPAVVTVP